MYILYVHITSFPFTPSPFSFTLSVSKVSHCQPKAPGLLELKPLGDHPTPSQVAQLDTLSNEKKLDS